jgi:hypothetical protein
MCDLNGRFHDTSAGKWIKQARDAISPDIIRKSFKKCGISNAIDGSEDNLFQNDDDDTDSFEGFDELRLQMVILSATLPEVRIDFTFVLAYFNCCFVIRRNVG